MYYELYKTDKTNICLGSQCFSLVLLYEFKTFQLSFV